MNIGMCNEQKDDLMTIAKQAADKLLSSKQEMSTAQDFERPDRS